MDKTLVQGAQLDNDFYDCIRLLPQCCVLGSLVVVPVN